MIDHTKKARNLFIIYACIFVIALFYRSYNLDKRGYFPGSDAPSYAGIVKTYRAGLDYIVKSKILKHDIGSMNDYLYENGVQFGTGAKDGIVLIGLLGSIIFGNDANAMLYTSAIFGVFTVMLLLYILLQYIDPLPAALIALLFAVSPYHIGFSREGLSVTFSGFFLLLSIYLYIKFIQSNRLKHLSFCGLSLGFGFLCHYNIAPFVFTLLAYEAYHFFSKRSGIKRIWAIAFFAFLPLFLMDLLGRAIKLYGTWQSIGSIGSFSPYFSELLRQLTIVTKQAELGGSDIHAGAFYYFNNLFYHEGIIASTFLIVAVVLIICKDMKADKGAGYFLVSMFLLPFIYFLWMMRSVGDRQMLNFIPLWYLIIGYGLGDLKRHRKLFAAAIAVAVILSGFRSLDYFNYRSNFEQAVAYMKQHKGVKHITSVMPISRLYVGRGNAVNHADPPYSERLTKLRKIVFQINPLSLDKIESLYNSGYNYLLLNIPPSVSNELTESALAIQPEYSTDAMICNDRGDGYDPALLRDKKGNYLYRFAIYDLGEVLDKIGR